MRISEEEQTYTDFDWFCIDAQGRVGHFTSAGFKRIPDSVAKSAEDLEFLNRFFSALTVVDGGHDLDEFLSPAQRTERYLGSFVSMADRGLFSFDIESYLHPGINYFRVAIPRFPLQLANLPFEVQEILGRTVLRMRSFEVCSVIPYQETLNI